MSVIIKSNGVIKMYTKGADSIVKGRLASDQKLVLDDELTKFSRIGLRTLLIAMRTISEPDYTNFKKKVEKLPN
jgi:phospholipid-translocating ATPase